MNNLFTVLKATFINDWGLNAFSSKVTSKKEKKKILSQLIIMMIGCAAIVYSVTIYALLMAKPFEEIGYLGLVVVFGMLVSILITFFTSVYKAQGILFASKDYYMLMSLPIKPSVILTSKLINLLVLNWIFTAISVIPPSLIYYVKTENISWLYIILLIISIFFIPLIPVILASLTAIIISYFASKAKRYKNSITIAGTLILVIFIMICSFKMQNLMEYLVLNAASIIEGLSKIYPPIAFLYNALIDINLLAFCKFILISIIPFILFVILFNRIFFKINSRLTETYKKGNYKLTSLKINSVTYALINKEIKGYFSTPIYIVNTITGMVMALMAAIATLFIESKTLAMYLDIPYVKDIFPLMSLGVMIFCIGLSTTTNSSISLEGRNLWIVKSMPIKEKDIFLGKIFLNLLITIPASITSNIIFFFGLKFNIKYLILNLIITTLFCFFIAVLGLLINLCFPKLEWSNPTVVVKQSASVLITMLITFACVGIPVGAFILLKITNIVVFLSVIPFLLIILSTGVWVILNNKGVKKFREL